MVRLGLMGFVVVDRLNGLGHLQGCGVQVWQWARVRVDGHLSLLLPLFCSDLRCFRRCSAVFRQTILCAKKPSRTRPHCCWVFQPPFPQIEIIGAAVIVWRVRRKTIRSVRCNIVCNSCAQCDAHTYEQTNSCLDWVLSHWAHFTVLDSFLYCVLLCVVCMIA